MDNQTTCFVFFLIFLAKTSSIVIDNEIEGGAGPRVYCFQNGLKLQVETKNPFTGRIYVKGQYNNPQCNRNFTGETKQPGLNVAYSECVHNRERLAPGGMMFTLEVVVQFHPFFTTKIDRGFVVSCSYLEGVNVVTQNQVLQGNIMLPDGSSDSIPVTIVSYSPLMPNCKYTIHRGSPDGPLISFAKVGEKVVHKWQCYPTADGEFHGLLVHNCFARDVRGVTRIQTLDKRGCTLDPFSLPTPTYTLDLTMAYAEVHAFKFADDLQISFSCSISLCLRMNGGCVGISPPNCGSGTDYSTTVATGGGYPPAGGSGAGGPASGTGSGYPPAPPAVGPGSGPSYTPAPPAGGPGSSYAGPGGPGSGNAATPAPYPPPATASQGYGSQPSAVPTPHPAGQPSNPGPGPSPPSQTGPGSYVAQPPSSNPAPSGPGAGGYPAAGPTAAKPAYAFAKSAPAASVYYPPGYSNNSLSYPPSGPPRGLPAGYEPAPSAKSNSTHLLQNDSLSMSLPVPPPAHFISDLNTQDALIESTSAKKASNNQSLPWGQMTDLDFENLLKELSPAQKPSSVVTDSQKTSTLPADINNLGIFVGEGIINVQPILKPVDAHKPSPAAADAAGFLNSRRKDSKPIGPTSRKESSSSSSVHKKPKSLLGDEQDLRVPKNGMFDDSDTEGVIEASFELEAQDFVVFDKQSPIFTSKDTVNTTTIDFIEYFDDDEGIIRRANGQTICVTTFVFTQIIILLAFCFSILMALAVFFRMRNRSRKSIHINESRL